MNKLDEVRSRPATVVFNSRMDARHLATLLAFWHSKDEKPTSVSELVRLSLESFTDLLVTNKMTSMVQTHVVALEMFERAGIVNQKMKTLNQKNLMKALSNENLNMDSLSGVDPMGPHKLEPKPAVENSDYNLALASLEKNLSGEVKERTVEAQERTDDFKKTMGVIPEESV